MAPRGRLAIPWIIMSALCAATCAAQNATPVHIVVGANVRVSAQRGGFFHGELWAAADPKNPARLILGSMAYDVPTAKDHSIAYVSQDAGRTWNPTLDTGESVDPACAYDTHGNVYFLHLNRAGGGMEIYRSVDGGKKWGAPRKAPYMDRPYIAVREDDRLFIHAHEPGAENPRTRVFTLFTSLNGSDFTAPVTPPGKPALGVTPGNAVFLADGTFVAVFVNITGIPAPLGWVGVTSSRDRGAHLTEPVRVSDWYNIPNSFYLSSMPQIAVDRSARFKDRLYAVWPDTRSGRSEIYVSWSADRGITWSAANVINDDAARKDTPGPDHLQPAIAVNRDGTVGISWYDRRDDAENRGWRARFSASLDGGLTFLPSVAISEAAYIPAKSDPQSVNEVLEKFPKNGGPSSRRPRWNFAFTGGDTAGIAAGADGVFHTFWTDNRTGVMQVFTSSVTVK